jgi:hypothetical protein
MLAAEFGWQAAESSKSTDNAETAAVAEHISGTEIPSSLEGAAADHPSLLVEKGSQAPSYADVGSLRMLQDYEAIAAGGDRAAALPGQNQDAVDPLTTAAQLLGPRSSRPPLPGLPGEGGRGESLAGMLETFRGTGSGEASQDAPHDPFKRVGWASDFYFDTVDDSGNHHYVSFAREGDGWVFQHQTVHRDGTYSTEVTTFYDDGDFESSVYVSDDEGEGDFATTESDVIQLEPIVIKGAPKGDKQPNPTDDSDGLGFLDRDPWALFLAWYTGQRGSKLNIPGCDNPGGLVEGQGQGSAAPGVGLEAVINPVDPLWGTSGGGGGDGSLPTLGCPTPVGPPRWMG